MQKATRILLWVAHDSDFTAARLDSRFKQWINKGITSCCSVTNNKSLKSFQQLTRTNNLERQDFYRYLQLRTNFEKHIEYTGEEDVCLIKIFVDIINGKTNRKMISRISSSLQLDKGLSTLYVKARWEKDANITLTEEEWFNV